MRTLSSNTAAGVAADVTLPRFLVKIAFSTPVYLTTNGAEITWDGKIWVPYNVQLPTATIDANTDFKGDLTFGNADNAMSAQILGEGVADRQISIWMFYGTGPALASDDPVMLFYGVGSKASCGTDGRIIVSLAQQSGVLEMTPRQVIGPRIGANWVPPAGTIIDWDGQAYRLEPAR